MLGIFTVILLIFSFQTKSYAHPLSAAFTTIAVQDDQTKLTYSIDTLSVIEGVGGDQNGDDTLDSTELKKIQPRVEQWVEDRLVIEADEKELFPKLEDMIIETKSEKELVTLTFTIKGMTEGQSLQFTDGIFTQGQNAKSYTNFLSIKYDNQSYDSVLQGKNREMTLLLTPSQQQQSTDTPAVVQPATETTTIVSWSSFLKLGMEHILTGYDHLLFLLVLLLRKQSLKEYILLVTAFTVAHSITLSLAVLDIADLPSRFVEAAIALSICYVALENIFKKTINRRWLLTFFFGLIHGLGFANILKDMDIAKEGLVTALISFNVGIEFVQVIIVLLLLPLLTWLQRKHLYKTIMISGSILTFVMGGVWLVERVFL